MPNKVEGSVRAVPSAAVIAASASLSGAIDCEDTRISRIQIPSAWTTANITFQTSVDGVTYADLYDSFGVEYVVTAAASREIILPLADFLGIRFLKIRSGTTGTPVTQSAARSLPIMLTA